MEPIGKPKSIHFRFETYADELRFERAVKASASNPTMILRNLAKNWVEQVEATGPVEFPVSLSPRRIRRPEPDLVIREEPPDPRKRKD